MRHIFILGVTGIIFLVSCNDVKQQDSHPNKRIISLAPNITEMIFALGEEKKLIAVTDFCTWPEEAETKEKIGGFLNPNLEKIITLKPDLLIGLQAHAELAQKLKERHLNTVLLHDDNIDDIFNAMDSLGILLEVPGKAGKLISSIRDSIAVYKQRIRQIQKSKPDAMLVLGRDPGTTRNIGVIGSHNYLDSLWTLLGGQNVFKNIPMKFSQIGRESVLTADPDIIIEFKPNEVWNAEKNKKNSQEWMDFSGIKAVNNNHIFVITGQYALIPGPRIHLLAADYFRILERYFDAKE